MLELTLKCPKCGAGKNKPCVYIWPSYPSVQGGGPIPSSLAENVSVAVQQQQMERAGTPTQRPHNERYQRARAKLRQDAQREREASEEASHAERRDILRANADAVQAEHEQLRELAEDQRRDLLVLGCFA